MFPESANIYDIRCPHVTARTRFPPKDPPKKKKKKQTKSDQSSALLQPIKKNKQKATKRTLIFQVLGPAHKIKLRRGIRIVYMHLIIQQRLFAIQTNPLLFSISESLFLLKGRLHCLVAASNNQVRF